MKGRLEEASEETSLSDFDLTNLINAGLTAREEFYRLRRLLEASQQSKNIVPETSANLLPQFKVVLTINLRVTGNSRTFTHKK